MQHQQCHSSFVLDAIIVIEVDVSVYQIICFVECLWLVSIDTSSDNDLPSKTFEDIVAFYVAFERNSTPSRTEVAAWAA